jgi:hypothetical protein
VASLISIGTIALVAALLVIKDAVLYVPWFATPVMTFHILVSALSFATVVLKVGRILVIVIESANVYVLCRHETFQRPSSWGVDTCTLRMKIRR